MDDSKNKALPSGAIRKSLLTPYRRIGLSKKWKSGSFKSPLNQENIVLNQESPLASNKESPVLLNSNSSSNSIENKRKNDNLNSREAKRLKRNNESSTKQVKKKLIQDDVNKIQENKDLLNVSGCNLLEVDEESNKNQTDDVQVVEKTGNGTNKENVKAILKREVSVSLERLSSNCVEETVEKCGKHEIKDNLNEEVSKNDKLNKNKNSVVDEHYKKDLKKTTKDKTKKSKKIENLEKENSVKNSSKIIEKSQVSLSPKTISIISSELEVKPIINSLNDTSMKKLESKSKRKNNIDEYIRKKEKQKMAKTSSSKLSLKKTVTKSSSLESDEDFIEKPSSQNSKKSDSSMKSIDKSELIDNIYKLQKTLADKEAQLGRYKQAEVYHKLHDINKLHQLKSIWKSGCETALQDLFMKMQGVGESIDINMSTLLVKLGAPSHVFKYDEENCVFV